MISKSLLLFFTVISYVENFLCVSGQAGELLSQYKIDVVVNETYKVSVGWSLNYETEIVDFVLEIKPGRRFEWLAFGFSDIGEFTNSDVYLFHGDKATDGYVDRSGALRRDVKQDIYEAQTLRMPDNRLVMLFSRPFNTGDTHDIQLETFVAGPRNIEIPAKETTYWCSVVLLPRMMEKNHVIKYEVALDPGHEKYVHHMEVYHCESPPTDHGMPMFNGPCTEHKRPPAIRSCRKVLAAWAMGAEPLVYPEEAGIPVGGRGYYPFALVETHYNNPHLDRGVLDSSGIRFYYTPNLRKFDAGILETGLIYSDEMAIPPKQDRFPLTAYCTPDCTEAGDTMVTTCMYNTAKRSNVTLGGLGIKDEMCVNYIHYYPKSELEVCKSSVDTQSLDTFFQGMRHFEGQDTNLSKSTSENYRSIIWNRRRVKQLDEFYRVSPIRMECLKHDGLQFPGKWEELKKPKIFFH